MRHVMCKYDTDHSGSIDLEEFTHYMAVGPTLSHCRTEFRHFSLASTNTRKYLDGPGENSKPLSRQAPLGHVL